MYIVSQFKPAWWASNRHLQTIWGAMFRRMPAIPAVTRVRIELADGDFIDVDRCGRESDQCVMLLHGLEGSIDSHYIRALIGVLIENQFQVAVLHFRGCSGEDNRLLRSYHSGVSDDLQAVIEALILHNIQVDHLVGFSLGGNVLLKWLGENHANQQVKSAVAVSVPLLLDECASSIDQGFSKIYSARLLKTLKEKTLSKKVQFPEAIKLTSGQINRLSSFWAFDHQVTAPLNGFASAKDYYQQVSSRQFLPFIKIPTLIIHAEDDPFMNSGVIPEAAELSPAVQFELSKKGGHVGFIQGRFPWCADYYLEKRILAYLQNS